MTLLGNNHYQINYLPSVVKEDIPSLPKEARSLIQSAIEQRLVVDPIGYGKPLRHNLSGHRRLRVSDYRVVYRIENAHTVLIVTIKHRKDVYD
jgi:mRNA interferase RelE/StbE